VAHSLLQAKVGDLTNKKLVFGVGVNDADYTVNPTIDGERHPCPYYVRWHSRLKLCYHPLTQALQPSYKGCKVCDEWLVFSKFKAWMESQNWYGLELDKDLLGNGHGKLYSPETCVFVSKEVNMFTTGCADHTGEWPMGVHLNKRQGKFDARIRVKGVRKFLGLFDSPQEAHQAWRTAKWELGCDLMEAQSCYRTRRGLWNYLIRL
jgi:hypothetical protein